MLKFAGIWDCVWWSWSQVVCVAGVTLGQGINLTPEVSWLLPLTFPGNTEWFSSFGLHCTDLPILSLISHREQKVGMSPPPVAVKFRQDVCNNLCCHFVVRILGFDCFVHHHLYPYGLGFWIPVSQSAGSWGSHHLGSLCLGTGEREALTQQRRAKHAKYALHFLCVVSTLEWKIAPDFLRFGGFTLAFFPHSHFTSSWTY